MELNGIQLALTIALAALVLATGHSGLVAVVRRGDSLSRSEVALGWFIDSALPATVVGLLLVSATTWAVGAFDQGWSKWEPLAFEGIVAWVVVVVVLLWEAAAGTTFRATTKILESQHAALGSDTDGKTVLPDGVKKTLRRYGVPKRKLTPEEIPKYLKTRIDRRNKYYPFFGEIAVAIVVAVAGFLILVSMYRDSASIL